MNDIGNIYQFQAALISPLYILLPINVGTHLSRYKFDLEPPQGKVLQLVIRRRVKQLIYLRTWGPWLAIVPTSRNL